MTTHLDDFETRLLASLKGEIQDRSRPPLRRPLLIGAAAAAAASLAVAPALSPAPAFSVSEGNAGQIKVEIRQPEDADGLERALEEHGIAADITYLPELQVCAPGRYASVDRSTSGLTTSVGGHGVGVTIPPGTVRDGETFVLTWSSLPMTPSELAEHDTPGVRTVEGAHTTIDFGVAAGAVGPCTPVPAPGTAP